MGNMLKNKRTSARRAAGFLAVLGALVMSSGVALMATATSANAAPADKVVVCKYVSTPGGELDHIVIVSENTLPDGFAGSFPFEWQDAQGNGGGSIAVRHAADGEQAKDVPVSDCPSGEQAPEASATVTFVDPSCANNNVASYTKTGQNVTFNSPAAAAGASITVTATATGDAEFAGGTTTKDFQHTFGAAQVCSTTVSTPGGTTQVSPPTETKTETKTKSSTAAVTPTVVHAGLSGATVQDVRAEQGLALMFAGMVMLVAAGGLGLRLRGGATRI